jgi:hypothetical protein
MAVINHRAMSDLISVSTAIGLASDPDDEQVVWRGISGLRRWLDSEKPRRGIADHTRSLSEMFPPDNAAKLPSFAAALILLFGALDEEVLDLMQVNAFFSRTEPSRFKPKLRSLYRVVAILRILEVIERTENAGEVRLKDWIARRLALRDLNPLAIDGLPKRSCGEDFIAIRRATFRELGVVPARWGPRLEDERVSLRKKDESKDD